MVWFVGFLSVDQEYVELLKTLVLIPRVNFLNESFVFVLAHLWQNILVYMLKS